MDGVRERRGLLPCGGALVRPVPVVANALSLVEEPAELSLRAEAANMRVDVIETLSLEALLQLQHGAALRRQPDGSLKNAFHAARYTARSLKTRERPVHQATREGCFRQAKERPE